MLIVLKVLLELVRMRENGDRHVNKMKVEGWNLVVFLIVKGRGLSPPAVLGSKARFNGLMPHNWKKKLAEHPPLPFIT